jgi:hypothetical protein
MLNARLVNALISCFSPPSFCESFRVSGRIPRVQNPFKYTRNFQINQPRRLRAGAPQDIVHDNQWLASGCWRLTYRQVTYAILYKVENAARNAKNAVEMG